jgi:putative ABC transport system ATP-binding protein
MAKPRPAKPDSDTPLIEVTDLVKEYQTGKLMFRALDGVSLKVMPGSFVGVMGRSGSGKSTLLYQMSLLDQPTSGEVRFRGDLMSSMSEEDCSGFRLANLGYVFQDYALLPELSAIENVALPIMMTGISQQKAYEQSLGALVQVGLKDKENNRPSQLSGGEKQRVSIARAIANCPAVVFADEPTANLDTSTAAQVMAAFKALHDQGQTIVMVTHEPEYRSVFDRVVELRDGRIISE